MIPPSQSSRYHGLSPIIGDGIQYFPTLFDRPLFRVVGERLHTVTQVEEKRPDLISSKHGGADEWWVILDYNDVVDPLTLRDGDNLRVPLFTLATPHQVQAISTQADEVPESSSPPP